MQDKDRGTYSPPTEDNLSYETRRTASRDQAPLTLIISGIVLVVVLLAAVLLYNSGLNNHNKVIPEVGDSLGDFKDGKVTDAQPLNDSDLTDGTDASGAAKFAPGTEAPGIRSATADDQNLAPAPVAPIEGPLPSQSSVDTTPVPGAAAAASAAPVVAPAAKPVVATPAVAKPVVSTGSTSVQIGAFTSQDIANGEYAKVASSYGLFVGGAGKKIEKVETASGTFYRTAFTGLTPDKAKSFCSALKAAGHDCIVR